jgi:hypothetical protein
MSTIYVECPSRPTKTFFDLMREAGYPEYHQDQPGAEDGELAWRRYRRAVAKDEELIRRQKSKIIAPSAAPFFICGSIEAEPFCACGHTAELLCDHPMGRGKTCDLNLCWCCGKHIGGGLDLCRIHFAEFIRRAGAQRINPWPPPRSRR